jgi:hypothetical protein
MLRGEPIGRLAFREELDLSALVPWFRAANPVAMMKMIAPQGLVMGAYTIVLFADFVRVVVASHAAARPESD